MSPLIILLLFAVAVGVVVYVYPDMFSKFTDTTNLSVGDILPSQGIPQSEKKEVNFYVGSGDERGLSGGHGSPAPPPPPVPTFSEAVNAGSFGSSANGKYYENDVQENFVTVAGAIGLGGYQNGTATEAIQGEMRFGTPSQWGFLHKAGVGSNITSINFWLKGDVDGAPEYPIIQTVEDPDNTNYFYLYAQNTALRIHLFEDSLGILSGASLGSNSRPPDDSNWHMVSLIMNKGNDTGVDSLATVWLDGVRITPAGQATANTPFTGTGSDSDQSLIIGSENGASAVTENGYALDDLTVWNGYQLTQSDIDDLYNSGTGSSAGSSGESIALGSQVLHVTFDSFI